MSPPVPVESRRAIVLACAPLELWPLVSNTNRLNRLLGLPEMIVEGEAGGFAKKVSTRPLGPLVTLSWREPPFEWVEGRYFRLVREFYGGPIERVEGRVELSPEGSGTRLTVWERFHPRGPVGSLLCRLLLCGRLPERIAAAARSFDASLKDAASPDAAVRRAKTPPHAESLRARLKTLAASSADPVAAERLAAHLEHAFDDQLHGMRPFELADRWGLKRIPTLKAFLHAVKAGLLDMSWEVLCPNCSASKQTAASLSRLKESSHCDGCGITYDADLGENVELRFAVNPGVRPISVAVYCVGNPAQTPFAAAQLLVDGAARQFEADLFAESYALRDLAAKKIAWLRPAPEGPSRVEADLSRLDDGAELRFKPGVVTLAARGAGGLPALLRLERTTWRENAARASLVTALQEFRTLFSSEVLAPGVEIGVKGIAVLFSDLKDSTALYERIGDATAYALVRDHFDYLFAIVAAHDGAVVKTIGDAVMAAFPTADQAVAAALEMQERLGELNAKLAPKPPVVLKLGVHQGAVIAINANGMLDYFGTTVNAAARVQNESKGGDIVVTKAVGEDPAVAARLKACGCAGEPFRIRLKGLSEDYELVRLRPKPRR